jgi:hypothetical protein
MNKKWYDDGFQKMAMVPCHFDLLPSHIDMLFIDGGEYDGEKEFEKLLDRSRIIILDDTRSMKCKKNRKHLLFSREFRRIFDDFTYRNGACGYERLERKRSVISNIPVFLFEPIKELKLLFLKTKRHILILSRKSFK